MKPGQRSIISNKHAFTQTECRNIPRSLLRGGSLRKFKGDITSRNNTCGNKIGPFQNGDVRFIIPDRGHKVSGLYQNGFAKYKSKKNYKRAADGIINCFVRTSYKRSLMLINSIMSNLFTKNKFKYNIF